MHNLIFEQILEESKEKIYRICRIYATLPVEPQDLFQEVALQIWKSFSDFEGKSSIDTWIYRISLNVCMRHKLMLEKSSSKSVRFDSIKFALSENPPDEAEEEKYRFLKECIASLNESDTSVIVLYLEDLPYKQISQITGLNENHVAVKMKRIRKKLFDCIHPKLS